VAPLAGNRGHRLAAYRRCSADTGLGMLDESRMKEGADGVIRTLRFIYASMVVGNLVFLGVAAMLKGQLAQPGVEQQTPILLGALGVLGVGCVAGYSVVERMALARLAHVQLGSVESELLGSEVLAAYRQVALVGAALIDWPVLLAVVIYLLTGSGIALGAALLAVGLLVSRIPSRERLERFAARSREQP